MGKSPLGGAGREVRAPGRSVRTPGSFRSDGLRRAPELKGAGVATLLKPAAVASHIVLIDAIRPKIVDRAEEAARNTELRIFLDALAKEPTATPSISPRRMVARLVGTEVSPALLCYSAARHPISLFFDFSGIYANSNGFIANMQKENAISKVFDQLRKRLEARFPGIIVSEWADDKGKSVNIESNRYGIHFVEVEFPEPA